MKAKQAGGIAFIDGNFEVTGGVEGGQLFPFGHVGIGLGDAVYYLIAFENDAEMAAFTLFFKLFVRNVDDDVLKMVDEDDLPFYPVAAEGGAQRVFLEVARIRTNIMQAGAGLELVKEGAMDVRQETIFADLYVKRRGQGLPLELTP